MSKKKDKNHELLVINLHSSLKKKLRIKAAKNDQTMTGFVTSLIEKEVRTN